MRIFADTNVLFDIFAQREPFKESSYKLMIMQMFDDLPSVVPERFLCAEEGAAGVRCPKSSVCEP